MSVRSLKNFRCHLFVLVWFLCAILILFINQLYLLDSFSYKNLYACHRNSVELECVTSNF